jgi:hypothetical protein
MMIATIDEEIAADNSPVSHADDHLAFSSSLILISWSETALMSDLISAMSCTICNNSAI